MANNFLQFSEMLKCNKKQLKWFDRLLTNIGDDEYDHPAPIAWKEIEAAAKAIRAWEGYQSYLDFQWSIEDDHIWFRAEESGEPYLVGLVVREFFRHFNIDKVFTLTWASFCDKLRVGEFSGGGMIVTRRHIEIREASEWMTAYLKKLEKRKPGT